MGNAGPWPTPVFHEPGQFVLRVMPSRTWIIRLLVTTIIHFSYVDQYNLFHLERGKRQFFPRLDGGRDVDCQECQSGFFVAAKPPTNLVEVFAPLRPELEDRPKADLGYGEIFYDARSVLDSSGLAAL